ncbi:MAG: hypothetical protein UHI93_07040, partial [Acutalibacteraceae bacterium]|nr:hypothetical protein [Acutalibacteraceae bacterium]
MYLEEERTIEAVLRAALESPSDELRLRLVDRFREQGYEALAVGKEPRPNAPSVVVFDDLTYAVIYLFTGDRMNEAEFEVFRKEAQEFAWDHDAA